MKCPYCTERIEPSAEVIPLAGNQQWHTECFLRAVIGSVAHIERRCSCYVPGSTEEDPPGMTVRESARAAWAAYQRRHPLII